MATGSPTDYRGAAAHAERPHNPCREAMQERVVRQIRMLRARRRELETGLRPLLHGHAGGNPGHSQGAAYELPRQFPTLPGPAIRSLAGGRPSGGTTEPPLRLHYHSSVSNLIW
jgi:hypothetical protein